MAADQERTSGSRRRWRIGIIVLAGLVVVGLGIFLVRRVLFPGKYVARGTMCLGQQRNLMSGLDYRRPEKYVIEAMQREQAARLTSEYNIHMFLGQPEAQELDWVRRHKGDKRPLARVFLENLKAVPVPGTSLVEVRFADRDPKAAVQILNEFMRSYERRTGEETLAATARDRRALDDQKAKIELILLRINGPLADLHRSKDFENPGRDRGEAVERVGQLTNLEIQAILAVEQARRVLQATTRPDREPDQRTAKQAQAGVEAAMAYLEDVRTLLNDARDKRWEMDWKLAEYHMLEEEKAQNEQQLQRLQSLLTEIDVQISRGIPAMEVFSQAVPEDSAK